MNAVESGYIGKIVTNHKTAFFVSTNHRAGKVPRRDSGKANASCGGTFRLDMKKAPLLRRAALKILSLIRTPKGYMVKPPSPLGQMLVISWTTDGSFTKFEVIFPFKNVVSHLNKLFHLHKIVWMSSFCHKIEVVFHLSKNRCLPLSALTRLIYYDVTAN